MKQPYDALLFDLDGTISDSKEGIFNCFRAALALFGVDGTDECKMMQVLGPPLKESFMQLYGLNEKQTVSALQAYRARYADIGIYENRLYNGMEQLLAACKQAGYKIALATSKPEVFSKRIVAYFGLEQYFDFVTGASLDESRSTKEAVIAHILQSMHLDASRALMIGDRKHDLIGAQVCGMDAVGVLYGYGDRAELEGYPHVYLAEDVNALLHYLT